MNHLPMLTIFISYDIHSLFVLISTVDYLVFLHAFNPEAFSLVLILLHLILQLVFKELHSKDALI